MLIIHPPYVHVGEAFSGERFAPDPVPFLPVGPLYAGEIFERTGRAEGVDYVDCQLTDLSTVDLSPYDSFGITAMGAQNIAPAHAAFELLKLQDVRPDAVHIGGQGPEGMLPAEFELVFPGAHQVTRDQTTAVVGYWDVCIDRQVAKLPREHLATYLHNELTLLFSQGCIYGCLFCGAQTRQREQFFSTRRHVDFLCAEASALGLKQLNMYCTSLDFFQQMLPGGDPALLVRQLQDLLDVKEQHGIELRLRALTRADSYLRAMESPVIRDLVARAGFYKFGFGADGAASVQLLKAMHKGTRELRSDLLSAFELAEELGHVPEILYVFGIPEDTEETLAGTRNLCVALLESFQTSEYRGFPAKNEIPGNLNWQRAEWRQSGGYRRLLTSPNLFVNLGFETLANSISHDDEAKRRAVNAYAVDMSYVAHEFGRVQSYLTVPITQTGGGELMDSRTFGQFREIVARYAPEIAPSLTLDNLPSYRADLNRLIPKDT